MHPVLVGATGTVPMLGHLLAQVTSSFNFTRSPKTGQAMKLDDNSRHKHQKAIQQTDRYALAILIAISGIELHARRPPCQEIEGRLYPNPNPDDTKPRLPNPTNRKY